MADKSHIEWTDATLVVDRGGRRVRPYHRQDPSRPGQRERRVRAAGGESWCRGCRAWLATSDVRSGVCRPCANAEARAAYASDGAVIRAQKSARKRRLAVVPAWWRQSMVHGPCAYGCGRPATTLDHIWPVARGGESRPGNLAPCCSRCNSQKKDNDPTAWVDRGAAALPDLWLDLAALALEHGGHPWTEAT